MLKLKLAHPASPFEVMLVEFCGAQIGTCNQKWIEEVVFSPFCFSPWDGLNRCSTEVVPGVLMNRDEKGWL